MTRYMAVKYLSAEKNDNFLTDVCRPIQFVYSFDDSEIYLVDLDPLYSKIFTNDGYLNERFLISLTTLNSVRNVYFNKGYSEGVIGKGWGEESRKVMEKLLLKTDFMDRVQRSPYSQRVLQNFIKRLNINSE